MKAQAKEEIQTKKTVRDWVHRIKKIIELLNDFTKQQDIPKAIPYDKNGVIPRVKYNEKKVWLKSAQL